MSPEEFNRVFRAQLPMISAYLSRRVPFSEVEDLASDLLRLRGARRSKFLRASNYRGFTKQLGIWSLTFIASNLGAMASWPGSPNQ